MSEEDSLGEEWYEKFNRFAGDLYPGRYTLPFCMELAAQAVEIGVLAREKGSVITVHNYLHPEFHEIGELLGDSLGLAQKLKTSGATRVDFEAVHFMGATAKMILGDQARVFTCDGPDVLGCSLVSGTDYAWLERWKAHNPRGVLVTYVNSSAYAKSISDYICTSGNADRIIVHAFLNNPGTQILVLPDKFLGWVMKAKAIDLMSEEMRRDGADDAAVAAMRDDADRRIEVYQHAYQGNHASCYVHERIGDDAPELALEEYPNAQLIVHPECGCANSCRFKASQGILPSDRVYFLSTEQMVQHALRSDCDEFVVATELGLIYRLRKEMPNKTFHPVSPQASCRFMKGNTFPKLLRSLREDRVEIVFCDDGCCDPKRPYQDEHVVHINRKVAARSRVAIDRMLTI
ncbi:hypothetical protein EBS80_01355 [bacterium]|nr:hypothetical protein [bacterium]